MDHEQCFSSDKVFVSFFHEVSERRNELDKEDKSVCLFGFVQFCFILW